MQKKDGGTSKVSKWKQKLNNQPDEKLPAGISLKAVPSGGSRSNA
jgi:hypothetical protein